jgi:membrane dipeptidase
MFIVDAHQDLAWNMLTFNRDYSRAVLETRRSEQGTQIVEFNGDTLLGWPQYQEGQVVLIFCSLFASPLRRKMGDWDTECYADLNQARSAYLRQLHAYLELVDKYPDKFQLVFSRRDLSQVIDHWKDVAQVTHPVGLLVSMEGAEAIGDLGELEEWWHKGVRILGPAWAGNRFCGGTGEPDPLTAEGFALLEAMAEYGYILDLSHMDEKAALQALDVYPGTVVATHANALAMLSGSQSNRHLSDRVIRGIIERNGMIGIVPFNNFLKVDWSRREEVTLMTVFHQIDHICQIAGDAKHVGLGTDFDGGFGVQSTPVEIDTIVDLHKIAPILIQGGYPEASITAIFGNNWLDCIGKALPEK